MWVSSQSSESLAPPQTGGADAKKGHNLVIRVQGFVFLPKIKALQKPMRRLVRNTAQL
jgi:hypothetical protein